MKDKIVWILWAFFVVLALLAVFNTSCTSPMGLDDAHRKHMDLYDWNIAEEDTTK